MESEQPVSQVVTVHHISPEYAERMRGWLANRGGIALWRSANLSNIGASWSTPALTEDGQPYGRPTWQAEAKPHRVITDISECVVVVPREVRRFRVAIRRGDGLQFNLTAASTRKVRLATDKAGPEAWYAFDYDTQEAVILVPGNVVPLQLWTGK